jgi:hypothetical protein
VASAQQGGEGAADGLPVVSSRLESASSIDVKPDSCRLVHCLQSRMRETSEVVREGEREVLPPAHSLEHTCAHNPMIKQGGSHRVGVGSYRLGGNPQTVGQGRHLGLGRPQQRGAVARSLTSAPKGERKW